MSQLAIMQPAVVVEGTEADGDVASQPFTVSLVRGVPAALNGVQPVLAIRIADPERDAARLVRAAEQLLPLHREAPGMVILDEVDSVLGVVPRPELEQAVRQMRRGDYVALTRTLGLKDEYHPIPGDPVLPFIYWECPECDYYCVPLEGHEGDEPDRCERHDPPVLMVRRVHSGE